MPSSMAWRQLTLYAGIGAATNLVWYLGFLLLLGVGLPAFTAMTATYIGALATSFMLNRKWTFLHQGRLSRAAWRYLVAQSIGYGANTLLLMAFVSGLGWPAPRVQAAAIVLVAVLLFVLQKYWVFEPGRP
jgi:putative flippase GtrA